MKFQVQVLLRLVKGKCRVQMTSTDQTRGKGPMQTVGVKLLCGKE